MTDLPYQLEPFILPQTAQEARIASIIEPVIDGEDCELVQLKMAVKGPRAVLSVFVDTCSDETSIGIDALESLNRLIGDVLDVADADERLLVGSYDLEVSSPGLDRPLCKAGHFVKAKGQRIRLKTDGRAGIPRSMTAQLVDADAQGVSVSWPEGSDSTLRVPYDAMQQAHTVFVFEKKLPPKRRTKRV